MNVLKLNTAKEELNGLSSETQKVRQELEQLKEESANKDSKV